jgi:hypothetical protein
MGAAGGGAAAGAGVSLLAGKANADAAEAQSKWSARQHEFNRAMMTIERLEIDKKAQEDIALRQRDVSALLGVQNVTMAANGIDVDSEVAQEIRKDTKRQGREDVENIRNNAWRQAWGIQVKQADERTQAGYARAAGYMGAATSLVGGGAQAASYGVQYTNRK